MRNRALRRFFQYMIIPCTAGGLLCVTVSIHDLTVVMGGCVQDRCVGTKLQSFFHLFNSNSHVNLQ